VFVRAFERLISRKDLPKFDISDNFKTFKSNESKMFSCTTMVFFKATFFLPHLDGMGFRSVKSSLKGVRHQAKTSTKERSTCNNLYVNVGNLIQSLSFLIQSRKYAHSQRSKGIMKNIDSAEVRDSRVNQVKELLKSSQSFSREALIKHTRGKFSYVPTTDKIAQSLLHATADTDSR